MAYTFKHGDRPVDGYTIQRAVGRGGFGEVYYAISDGGREVALKYLRDNPQIELRGVSHCINLKSPHLVAIFDVKKSTDGEYTIIMEYCSGPSLRDLLIAEPNGFGPQKAAFFVREIAKGLAYLHDRGIVHRDLKPGNIFYDDGYVKIGDYGLSKFISVSRHSVQTASVGTVHYMAPEIGSGDYSRGIDIYALGVMLYEMLLGKVPFEGSTMAEVLMKHLTVQPELEQLPEPFGQVIRKALAKDPKDRYQNVDEMVGDLLDVQEVRESLAGFSPHSLQGAVRYGAVGQHDSPMPSPNPAPAFGQDFAQPGAGAHDQPPFALPVGSAGLLSRRVGKKMDRFSRKLEAKMAKLEGRTRRKRRRHAQEAPNQGSGTAPPTVGLGQTDRKKRVLLSALLSVGLAAGLGILVGNTADFGLRTEEAGVATGMLVLALSGSVLLARSVVHWFGIAFGPMWSRRLVQLCCAAPLLALGSAPLLESSQTWEHGMALWLGLLVVAVLGNWEKTIENASGGEMSFTAAVGRAFGALLATLIVCEMVGASPEEAVAFPAAGIAGAATLILQATAWWLPAKADRAIHRLRSPEGAAGVAVAQVVPPPPPIANEAPAHRVPLGAGVPAAEPVPSIDGVQGSRHPRERWAITRGFWGIVAFVLMGGTIVTFLIALIAEQMRHHDLTAVVVACTGFASFMIFFALRKTTPIKREGFWRETLRPFLISATLFGIGGTITGIAREWGHWEPYWGDRVVRCLPDEGRVLLVSGLVLCSILFIGLNLFTGRPRRPRPQKPFLQGSDPGTEPADSDGSVPKPPPGSGAPEDDSPDIGFAERKAT